MNQYAARTIVSAGLAVATLMLSFFGCNQDYGDLKGNCQVMDAGPDDCTIPKCNADGSPAPEPVPNAEKRVCFRSKNEGVCVDGACALTCETQMTACKCESDDACPSDKQCIDWACDPTGECKSALNPEDMVVDTLEMKDCKKVVCKSGLPQTVADDTDKPADTPKDCKQPVCMGDVPGAKPDVNDVPDPMECVQFVCNIGGSSEPANAPLGTKCSIGACDGNGACRVENGQTCANEAECLSGHCTDGVCCNTACTDECKSCSIMSMSGTCSNIPYYQEDPSYTPTGGGPSLMCNIAIAGSLCSGAGKCLRIAGTACTQNSQCISNSCTSMKCLGAIGELCTLPQQCVSGICMMGACK